MNFNLQEILKYWMQLRPRERVMLSVGGAVMALLMVYLILWEPVFEESARLTASVKEQKALVAWMQKKSAEVKQLQQSVGGSSLQAGQSLLGVIDSTAKSAKLGPAMKRVEPDGQSRVRVWMEEASFDDMVRWLDKLQRAYGVTITSAVVDQSQQTGRVNARFIFTGGA